jgi:hypothetical protein
MDGKAQCGGGDASVLQPIIFSRCVSVLFTSPQLLTRCASSPRSAYSSCNAYIHDPRCSIHEYYALLGPSLVTRSLRRLE